MKPASPSPNRKRGFPIRVLRFLGGYHLACALILLLGVLTWLGTLEQVELGLYEVKRKYFSSENVFLLPRIRGKTILFPLPGAYWVGLVFFFNLLIGTFLHVRWRWKSAGILIAHFGMLFLLLGAFVTQHFSQRGNMAVNEGETSNVAEHYHDFVIEVTETEDGKPSKIHVIATDHLAGLSPADQRLFRMKQLPFDLRIDQYHTNARPAAIEARHDRSDRITVDGFYLKPKDIDKEASLNFAGCRATVLDKDGKSRGQYLISAASYHPATIDWDGTLYSLNIRKALWPIPFDLRLDKFTHEFHPGTMRPKRFESQVMRREGGMSEPVLIKMNEPMRRKGYTFFQASWGPQGAAQGARLFSVLEVVKNPADKWPEYALYITTAGLVLQFGLMLTGFVFKQVRKGEHEN